MWSSRWCRLCCCCVLFTLIINDKVYSYTHTHIVIAICAHNAKDISSTLRAYVLIELSSKLGTAAAARRHCFHLSICTYFFLVYKVRLRLGYSICAILIQPFVFLNIYTFFPSHAERRKSSDCIGKISATFAVLISLQPHRSSATQG